MILKSTDEVVAYLTQTARRADRGEIPEAWGIFTRAYLRVTLEIIARIADGYFEDPSWLAAFDVRFANKYKDAIDALPDSPRCWQIARDVAEAGGRDVLQHLMLGINAHMRYDLCVVLLDGFVDDRVRRKRDFDAVNRVMKLAVDPIEAVIEDRYMEWARIGDGAALRIDELLTYERFVKWRTRAWEDAMAILDGTLTREAVDDRVSQRARLMQYIPGVVLAVAPF